MTYMTKDQAAEYLGVSPRTIQRLVSGGRLVAYRLGGSRQRVRFLAADLDAAWERTPSPGQRGGEGPGTAA